MKKEITIYDIAKESGVSPSTVSRVMTNSSRVSPEKKKVVEAMIEKYKFRPNAVARGLSDMHTRVLGIMAADIRNPYYAALVVECEKEAHRCGYTVMLCNALNDPELEDANLEKLYDQRVDAIIQLGCRADDLVPDPIYVEKINRIGKSIPFIISGKLQGANCRSVYIDHTESMRLAVEHLISLGHKDIAMLGGSYTVRSTHDKRRQYVYLCGKYGLPLRDEYMQDGDYTIVSGYDCMNRLLDLDERPTAVIAVNDYTAVGALEALTDRGVSVPEEISIVSFDNTFLSEVAKPRLTSVDYNYSTYGSTLIHLAMQVINKEDAPRDILICPQLIVRDSCTTKSKSVSCIINPSNG